MSTTFTRLFADNIPEKVFFPLAVLLPTLVHFTQPGTFALRNVLMFLGAFILWRHKEIIPAALKSPASLTLAGFVAVALASITVNGTDWFPTLKLANWLVWFGLGFAAVFCMRRFGYGLYLLPALAAVGTFVAYILAGWLGLVDTASLWNNMGRLSMDFEAPTRLGMAYSMALALAAGVLVCSHNRSLQIISALLLAAVFLLLFLTASRGNIFAGLAVCLLAGFRGFKLKHMAYLAGVAAAVGLALLVLARMGSLSAVFDRAETVLTPGDNPEIITTSVPSRLYIWRIAANGFLEHPALGVGFNQFPELYRKEAAAFFAARPKIPKEVQVPRQTSNAHNFELHLLIETGVPGCLLLLAFFGLIMAQGFRHRECWPVGLAFVAIFLSMQLNFNLYIWRIGYPLMFFAGVSTALDAKTKRPEAT
jgi:O-antigen ligase